MLECETPVMKYIIDRFGENVDTQRLSDERFVATVEVALSPIFYAWVFQFGGAIRIKAPQAAVDEICRMAKAVLE